MYPWHLGHVGEDVVAPAVGDFLGCLVLLGWVDANRNCQRVHCVVVALLYLAVASWHHNSLCRTEFSTSCIDVFVQPRTTVHSFAGLLVR